MRIGEFAKSFDVSIDTVRHYMDMGIIVPVKDGGQYRFNEQCNRDMETALEMKSYAFSLKEVQSYLYYQKLTRMSHSADNQLKYELLENKARELEDTIERLQNTVVAIESKASEILRKPSPTKVTLGVPLDSLGLFACDKCNHPLILDGNSIIDNMVIRGTLRCECGWHIDIEDGILVDKEHIDTEYGITVEELPSFIADYIKETSPEFFKMLYLGIEWATARLPFEDGSTFMEVRTGSGYFIRTIFEKLSEDSTYICVDQDHRMNRFLKDIIESNGEKKRIIFISTSHRHIPIKNASVDYLVDMRGSLNYMIDPDSLDEIFFLRYFDHILKAKATVLANYLVFDHFTAFHRHIPNQKWHLFNKPYYIDELLQLDYQVIHDTSQDYLTHGSKYENYYENDDRLFFWNVIASRE